MSFWKERKHTALCANGCGRRATHLAIGGNLWAMVCVVCAGIARLSDDRIQLREMRPRRGDFAGG